jgi:hypothetical protein
MSQEKIRSLIQATPSAPKLTQQFVRKERERRLRERRRGIKTEGDLMDKVIEFVESKSVKIGLSQ